MTVLVTFPQDCFSEAAAAAYLIADFGFSVCVLTGLLNSQVTVIVTDKANGRCFLVSVNVAVPTHGEERCRGGPVRGLNSHRNPYPETRLSQAANCQ